MADERHDTGLNHGIGIDRRDRVGEALQPVDDRDQDVVEPARFELVHHPQSELRPLSLLDQRPHNLLLV